MRVVPWLRPSKKSQKNPDFILHFILDFFPRVFFPLHFYYIRKTWTKNKNKNVVKMGKKSEKIPKSKKEEKKNPDFFGIF